MWFTNAAWLVDAYDGSLLGSGTTEHEPLRGGYVIHRSGQPSRTVVSDTEGNPFLDVEGTDWGGWDRESVSRGRLGAGSAMYDVSTGSQLWSRPDLDAETADWGWAPDQRDVLVLTEGSAKMVDPDTGDTRWERAIPAWMVGRDFTDDSFVYALDDDRVEVVSRDDGGLAWTRSLSSTSEIRTVSLARTDRALVAVQDDVLTGFTGFAPEGDADPADGSPEYVTDCGAEPDFAPTESQPAGGGLQVAVEVTAVCPGGQWLSGDGLAVSMAAGEATYASARFDYSGSPVWVPQEGVTLQLIFPADTLYASLAEVESGIEEEVIHVDCVREPGSDSGEVPASTDGGASPDEPQYAVDAALPAPRSEESARAALERIAAADAGHVEDALAGSWMPQLSSKVEGTTDDGITYSYRDILAEHLRLRLRYDDPGVRLVNSRDWGSFLGKGYWVTLVDSTTPGSAPALDFCRSQGFDRDHCYAKRLLRDGPVDGSTVLLEE